jgi:pseudouridine-5'-phosphate glycosidase
LRVLPDIAAALNDRHPVVALESSVFAQGLPIPENREAFDRMAAAVRSRGAVPAVTAVVAGTPAIGLTEAEAERFLWRVGVRKVTARDLGVASALGQDGATTVAATLALASPAGIEVFATGGIGGVHRDAPFDESADLVELSRTPMIVVCAGAKSILDLPATIERLETLGVPVIGYGTDELPGFFTATTGLRLSARIDNVATIAKAFRRHRDLGRREAMVVVQPPPAAEALDRALVERLVVSALEKGRAAKVSGAAVTPFLLSALAEETRGASVRANLALLEANAQLAAEISVALSAIRGGDHHDNA